MREAEEINIALLGYGFMGRTHAHSYITVGHQFPELSIKPVLYGAAGIGDEGLEAFAGRFGFRSWTNDWRSLVDDPEVDAVDICLPEHLHKEACLAALGRNKHVLCEKPLALSAADAAEIAEASEALERVCLCGFNYRFLPAVRLARELIQRGILGRIYGMTASYAQDSGHDPDTPIDGLGYARGTEQLGSLRGLGSHLIDITRFLAGEIVSVAGFSRTFCPERPSAGGSRIRVDADETAFLVVEFENGAVGSLSTSVVATGRKNRLAFEISGSRGTICFDLENLNYLEIFLDQGSDPRFQGFTRINVTDKSHPLMQGWWPPAHILGWEAGHVNEIRHFLSCLAGGKSVGPEGATFRDGALAAAVAEKAAEAVKDGEIKRLKKPDSSGHVTVRL